MIQEKTLTIPGLVLARNIAYWVFTSLIVFEMALGAFWDLFRIPFVRGIFDHLGLPYYVLTILGLWKLPGAVVLLIPRFGRLKEWAYAGAFFTYSGAAVLHMSVGDEVSVWLSPVVLSLITVASWALRPSSRRWVPGEGREVRLGGSGRGWLIGYWVVTVLVALAMIAGGISELAGNKTTVQGMLLLGYPVYFTRLLGCWKIPGGVALLVPRFPLVREWAYAGIFFDLSGAFATHLFCHSPAAHLISTGVYAALTLVSWGLMWTRSPRR